MIGLSVVIRNPSDNVWILEVGFLQMAKIPNDDSNVKRCALESCEEKGIDHPDTLSSFTSRYFELEAVQGLGAEDRSETLCP